MEKKNKLKYDEVVSIAERLNSGETVICNVCKEPLVLRQPGSGYHPGIFCPNGCTEIMIEMGRG